MAVPSRHRAAAAVARACRGLPGLRDPRGLRGRLAAVAAAALLAACAGTPPPDWALSARAALRNFEQATLRGDTRLADAEFARARAELARTGRADLVARAELLRCALRVASLDFDDCPGFAPLAQDADAASRAYAAFLAGRADETEAALLPDWHRQALGRRGESGALAEIDDPVSRLVAAGVLLRMARILPADIAAATETASQQGWRRPLLAWLGVSEQRALAAGDAQAAAQIRRRIELMLGAGALR